MATEYFVRVRDIDGVRQEDIGNFLSLTYSKNVNDVGSLRFVLPSNHVAIDALEQDGQIEVWRSDKASGIDWYCDFYGLYRDRDKRTPNDSNGIFTAKCVGQLDFLDRAIVAFPAGTANRNAWSAVPAETVMKTLVQYNATADATTANSRIRNVGSWANYITVATDSAGGSSITDSYAHKKLLATLQRYASIGGLDFDLVKTGARAWEFRTYALLGTDLSSEISFSTKWGNMGEPQLIGNAVQEPTVAIVAGSNQGIARDFVVRTGPNYAAGINDREIFVNASGQDASELAATGDARLNEQRATDALDFQILQTPAYRYGREYCISGQMGDLVNSYYEEGSVIKKIQGITVAVQTSSGGSKAEQIRGNLVTVA